MKICPNCNAQIPDNKKFCTECGTSMADVQPVRQPAQPAYTAPQPQPVYTRPQQPVYTQRPPVYNGDTEPDKDSKYAPITTKGFLGIMLLMCIPVIGQILLIIWAIGAKKVNKRNMARACLIMTAVVLVLSLVLGMVAKVFVGKVVEKAKAEAQVAISQQIGGDALAGLLGGEAGGSQNPLGALGVLGGLLGGENNRLGGIAGLLGGEGGDLGALLGEDFSAEDMAELEAFIGQLQAQSEGNREE